MTDSTTPQGDAAMSPASAGSQAKPSGVSAACAAAAGIGLAMQTVEGFEPVKLPQWEMVGEGTDGTPIYRNNWGAYGQWIPVSERLPEAERVVLICRNGTVGMARLYSDGWYWDMDEWHKPFTPTHWMPLPAPPADAK